MPGKEDAVGEGPCYELGEHTLYVAMEMHQLNRNRLCDELKKETKKGDFVVLKGGGSQTMYSSDREIVFRQESYFHWLFGVLEPNCYGAVDVDSGKSFLFFPKQNIKEMVLEGNTPDEATYQERYAVDEVHIVRPEKITSILQKKNAKRLLLLYGKNCDSGIYTEPADFDEIETFPVNHSLLHPIMTELRVRKSPFEIEILRYVCGISSEAHKEVMQLVRPGMKEYQAESIFIHFVYFMGGARHVSYTCVCSSGETGAKLHYGHSGAPNNKTLRDGELCLFDMGGEYYCYGADITCTFPVSGKFTDQQKVIYEAVLAAHDAVLEAIKPGVNWVDMHKLANKTLLVQLHKADIVKGEIEEMMKANVGGVFMPHGVGHFLGIDVHDVGGFLDPDEERPKGRGFSSLRTNRDLVEGMVLAVNPGCYFIDQVLDEAFSDKKISKFLVKKEIDKYRNFGGVRIEDDILVTVDGMEVLTSVPRGVDAIERLMAEGQDLESVFPQQNMGEERDKIEDELNRLRREKGDATQGAPPGEDEKPPEKEKPPGQDADAFPVRNEVAKEEEPSEKEEESKESGEESKESGEESKLSGEESEKEEESDEKKKEEGAAEK